MPIAAGDLSFLKSAILKKMVLLFSAVLLFNLYFKPALGAGLHPPDVSLLFENSSLSAKAKKYGDSSLPKRAKKPEKIRKTAGKNSQPAYNCSETFQDEYSIGYIQLGYNCDSRAELCVSVYHIERNYCRNGELTRYYCDPKSVSLFSSKKINCPGNCDSSGLFCAPQK